MTKILNHKLTYLFKALYKLITKHMQTYFDISISHIENEEEKGESNEKK